MFLTFAEELEYIYKAELPHATITDMDNGRRVLANRADKLIGKNRGKYDQFRASEAKHLQSRYDAVIKRMLDAGWQ